MASPQELEAAAGIQPASELDRKRIWAGAQALASEQGRPPGADDLRLAEQVLGAVHAIEGEHLAGGQGRAIITLTDTGEDIDVALEFTPELEQVNENEVAGTPAQVLALELVQHVIDEDDEDE